MARGREAICDESDPELRKVSGLEAGARCGRYLVDVGSEFSETLDYWGQII